MEDLANHGISPDRQRVGMVLRLTPAAARGEAAHSQGAPPARSSRSDSSSVPISIDRRGRRQAIT